jgi:hypothetical protein
MPRLKDQPPEYFPTRQAAQYLGVSAGWLASARCHGKGPPYVKFGTRSVRYHRRTLEAWMARRECDPHAGAQTNKSKGGAHGA